MSVKVPRSSRVIVVLVAILLLMVPAGPAGPAALHGFQAATADGLDRALRANDLQKARLLFPESWAATEQLFVSYLERGYLSTPELNARALAARWAEVHFRIVEYDFARSAAQALDTADPARRRQLIDAVRDYFTGLEGVRVTSPTAFSAMTAIEDPSVRQKRTSERDVIAKRLLQVADRFRALSFPRGELWTLRSMVNVSQSGMPSPTARADKIADQLGDELSLLGKRPFTDASLTMAERLGIVGRQVIILEEMAVLPLEVTDRPKLEQSAKYLERARVLSRSVPSLETVNYWLFPRAAPRPATVTLPDLWSRYHRLMRPADARPLVSEALEISRPFGESALLATISAFASRASGLDWEAAATLVEASRPFGQKIELLTLRQLSGSGTRFRPEVAEKALTLALAAADAHERAVTLEWYSRATISTKKCDVPPPFEDLLQLCLKSDESELAAEAMANIAECRLVAGSFVDAAAAFREAMGLAERSGHPGKAAQIGNRATRPRPIYNFASAARFEIATRTIEDAEKADDPLELARALCARALAPVGATHQSLDDLLRAVTAAERASGRSGSVSVELDCLRSLADEYEMRRDYQAAVDVNRRLIEKARAFEVPTLSVLDHQLAGRQALVSIYSSKMGEPALAMEAARELQRHIETVALNAEPPPDAWTFAEAYRTLAQNAAAVGQPVTALEYWDKALQKTLESAARPGGRPAQPVRRNILAERAAQYAALGDFEAALNDLEEVGTLISQTKGNYTASEALQRANWSASLAWTRAMAGNVDGAAVAAHEAIVQLDQDRSGRWPGLQLIEHIVEILLLANNPDDAIAFCTTAYEPIRGQAISQPGVERTFQTITARAYLRAGRVDEARSRLLAAAQIDRDHPTAEVGGLGDSLLELGKLETAAKNYEKAREYLVGARAAINPYDVDRIWRIERALALALSRLGDITAADGHYDASLTALESNRERLRPEEFRLRYGETKGAIYEEHAALLAARALTTGQHADAVRAFQAAERKRTQVLASLLAMGWSRVPSEAMPDQMRRSSEIEARMSAKRSLLMEQSNLAAGKRNDSMIETLERDLKRLQDDHARLLTSVAQSRYRYAAATTLATGLAGPVQAALGPSRALVEYLVTDERSYAFVVSSAGVRVIRLGVGRTPLRQQIERLLGPIRKLRSGQVDLARLEYDSRQAYDLYRAIFAPVRPLLGAATDIVIVPDDVLNFVPFEALVEAAPPAVQPSAALHGEYASLGFLLRRYSISYLPSAAELLSVRVAAEADTPSKRLFAMANPTAGRAAPPPAQDDPLKRQLRSAGFGVYLAPLPGAEVEVERIARTFPGGLSTVVVGANATEEAYKAEAGKHAILHFAAHAVASDGQPLYSTLVLAPGAKGGADGFLQAYEVLRTPLQADLVALSGCETALGAEDVGQGLVGLVAAFQQAGARSVLATLWSIDEATAEVMAAFYGAMAEGRTPPAALRQAKLQLLQQRVRMGKTEVSLAHPFFWAPFVLVGTR